MNIAIIAKGNTRRRRELDRAINRLRDSRLFDHVTVLESGHAGHATELAPTASTWD